MNSSDEKTYWESVVRKLESNAVTEREWASHVLATVFLKEEESNLALAVKHCGRARILSRAQFLADYDTDDCTGSYCLAIVERLKEPNQQPEPTRGEAPRGSP